MFLLSKPSVKTSSKTAATLALTSVKNQGCYSFEVRGGANFTLVFFSSFLRTWKTSWLSISINFTLKTSHRCLTTLHFPRFSRKGLLYFFQTNFCGAYIRLGRIFLRIRNGWPWCWPWCGTWWCLDFEDLFLKGEKSGGLVIQVVTFYVMVKTWPF